MDGTLPFHLPIPTKWMEELICAFLNKKKTAVLKIGPNSNQGKKIKFTVAVLFNQNPISLLQSGSDDEPSHHPAETCCHHPCHHHGNTALVAKQLAS